MSSAIEQALAAANAAAANVNTPTAANAVVVQPPAAVAQRLTLDAAIDASGLAVDGFLKFEKTGFLIDKGTVVFESFKAGFDLEEVKPVHSVRWGDTPVKYAKSEDNVHTIGSPLSWAQTLEMAARDPKPGRPYVTYEVPMTILEEVKDLKGNVVAAPGFTIGHTPSVTNVKDFAALFKKMRGKNLTRAEVLVKHRQKANGNNVWGAADFELIGEWIEGEDE